MEKLSNENFSLLLKKYREDRKLTLQTMVGMLDCEGCKTTGFLSEVERNVKKPNAEMVFAFEKLRSRGHDSQVRQQTQCEVPHEDSKLQVIIDEWPKLPDPVKRQMVSLAMVSTAGETNIDEGNAQPLPKQASGGA